MASLPTSNEELVDRTREAMSFFEFGRIEWSTKESTARALLTQDDGTDVLLAQKEP